MISHPFMTPAQLGDPPRHPPVVHDDTFVELDVPQQPVATTTMDEAPANAHADVGHPQRVVVKFIVNCHCYSFYLKPKIFSLLSMS